MLLNCAVGEDSWVPWTARKWKQSILKEISPEYSLEGLMLKLKLQYFGHLRQRTDSLEKSLMLGKIEGKRRRGRQRVGWHHRLEGLEFEHTLGVGDGQESLVCFSPWGYEELGTTEWLNWSSNLPFRSLLASMLAFICWTRQFRPLYFSLWESRGWKSTPGDLHQGKGRAVMLILSLSHFCFCSPACWLTGQTTTLNGMQAVTYRWWWKWWWKLWRSWQITQVPVTGLWVPNAISAGFFPCRYI